jgi:hypothetical protein
MFRHDEASIPEAYPQMTHRFGKKCATPKYYADVDGLSDFLRYGAVTPGWKRSVREGFLKKERPARFSKPGRSGNL